MAPAGLDRTLVWAVSDAGPAYLLSITMQTGLVIVAKGFRPRRGWTVSYSKGAAHGRHFCQRERTHRHADRLLAASSRLAWRTRRCELVALGLHVSDERCVSYSGFRVESPAGQIRGSLESARRVHDDQMAWVGSSTPSACLMPWSNRFSTHERILMTHA